MLHYKEEDNYSVWECLDRCMSKIRALIKSDYNGLESFNRWCRRFMRPTMDKLGWQPKEGESHLDSLLR